MYENICFEFLQVYHTLGRYDAIWIYEAEDAKVIEDSLHDSRMLDLLHDRAGDSCTQKNEKYIYIKHCTRYVRDRIDTAGRPRGEMISERESGRESEEMKKEGGSD